MRHHWSSTSLLVVVLGMTGCASSAGGGDQMQNTVYATHRLVQNLDRNMSGTVAQLNETTAELAARVENADVETRKLVSIVEENQRKLDNLQRRLDELTATLYRHLDLSPPSGSFESGASAPRSQPPVGVETGEVIVQPPSQPPSQPMVSTPGRTRPELEEMPAVEDMQAQAATGEDPDTYYVRAQELYNAGDYDKALEQFDSFLRLFPNSPNASNAQYWKAHSYFKLERFDRAVDEFQKLVNNYPSSGKVPIALHNQAVAYSRLNQVPEAIATFERLIRDYPNDVVADMGREKLDRLRATQ